MKKFVTFMMVVALMAVAFTTGVALAQNNARGEINRLSLQVLSEHKERMTAEKLVQDYEYINRKVDAIPAQYAISCFDTNTFVRYRFVKVGRTAQGNNYTVTYEVGKAHNAAEFADAIRAMENTLDDNEHLVVEVLNGAGEEVL